MSRRFLDTSAQVKLYVSEPATPLFLAVVSPSDDILVARLTLVEFRSALWGKVRQGQLLASDAQARLSLYDADYPQLEVIEIDKAVFDRAAVLIDRYAVPERLLPPDAIIVAAALEEHGRNPIDMFVTTDAVQAKIAAAEGLLVGP